MTRGHLIVLIHAFSGIALASCDISLRYVLEDAIERLASDHQMSLDRSKLASGVCLAPEDGGPGSGCEGAGKLRCQDGCLCMDKCRAERCL